MHGECHVIVLLHPQRQPQLITNYANDSFSKVQCRYIINVFTPLNFLGTIYNMAQTLALSTYLAAKSQLRRQTF